MLRFGTTFVFALILAVASVTALPASGASQLAGTWRRVPAAPSAVSAGTTGVWTGSELIVSGTKPAPIGSGPDVAEAYDLATRSWRHLAAPPKTDTYCRRGAVWTGKEMLVWGCGQTALNPTTNRWRRLPKAPTGQGIVVWTGREMIGWGGGCCGDAWSDGSAYKPTTNTWRKLATSPLAPSQGPLGAWTGRELLLFVSAFDPEGKRWPARFAHGAAYDPVKNTWRRIAPLPQSDMRFGGPAAWNGQELFVVSAGASSRAAFAYNPATNSWRRLASMPSVRLGASVVWIGKRLLLFGGETSNARPAALGLAYDSRLDRWSALPAAPLVPRDSPIVVGTGRSMLVWGGVIGTPVGTPTPPRYLKDGAAFTPRS